MAREPSPRRPRDLMPVVVLAAIILIALAGWLIFPAVQRSLFNQDCVASGHVNCGG